MRILVEVDNIELEGDYGTIPSVRVTCTQCGESVEVYGRSERSVKRGCIMLKEMCGGNNFYTTDEVPW